MGTTITQPFLAPNPMKEIPAMINVIPIQFGILTLSFKKNIETSVIQTKLSDHTGYNKESSPNFKAIINKIAANPYARKPKIKYGLIKDIMEKVSEDAPSLKES